MKQTIHIKQSELKNIITESVKNTLNELDWKTYANAEKKARERGQANYQREKGLKGWDAISKAADERIRANKFADAAKKAFNRDHGFKNGHSWDNDYAEVKMGGDFDATEEFAPHAIGLKSKGYGNPAKYEHGTNNDNFKKQTPEEFFNNNTKAAETFKNADTEIKNYKKGKYNYIPQQGYELNETKLNKLITESVKNTLKEHFNTIKDIKDIHKTSKMHKYKNKYDDDDNEQEDDELEKMTY